MDNKELEAMGITKESQEKFNQANINKMKKQESTVYTTHGQFTKITKIFSGIFLIACIIGGVILANEFEVVTIGYSGRTSSEFNTVLMLTSWIIGFVSYIVMYGIACIVENTEK